MDGLDQDCNSTDDCLSQYSLAQAPLQWTGIAKGDLTGYPVIGNGDVNGDGRIDLLFGAYGSDVSGQDAGAVYLLPGPVQSSQLQNAVCRLTGEAAGARTGQGLALLTGFDGDKCAELVIGAPAFSASEQSTDTQKGRLYFFFNHCESDAAFTCPAQPASADWILTGENAQDLLGRSIADVGDVNGDGLTDVLTSASQHGTRTMKQVGRAYLVLGTTNPGHKNGSILSASSSVLDGEQEGAWFGYDVASLGDINGDGISDFGISAPYQDIASRDEGATYIFFGRSKADQFPPQLSASDADICLEGVEPNSLYGFSLAGLGDLNDDGFDDFMVGAPLSAGAAYQGGVAWLYFGGTKWEQLSGCQSASVEGIRLVGDEDYLQLGRAFSGVGDVNADGVADFSLGLEYSGGGLGVATGKVLVFSGWTPGHQPSPGEVIPFESALASWSGEKAGDMAGSAVSGAGDVTGDGVDDVLIGAAAWGNAPYDWIGRVYVMPGSKGRD